MNFLNLKCKTIVRWLLVLTLVTAIATPGIFAALPAPTVKADTSSCVAGYTAAFIASHTNATVAAVLGVPVGANGQVISQGIQAGQGLSSFFQDCIEHALALSIGRLLLDQMTNSVVSYINGGFQGSPTFVTNPGKFFQNIGDQVAGNFIGGLVSGATGLNICSPFQLQVQTALLANFGYSVSSGNSGGDINNQTQQSCSLSQIVGNTTGALNNAYSQFTSWQNFLAISLNDDSNPYGAYLTAESRLEVQINAQVSINASQLNWGNGFLSQQTCTHVDPEDASQTFTYTKSGGNGGDSSATAVSGTNAPTDATGGTLDGTFLGTDANGLDVYSNPQDDQCQITTPGTTIAGVLQKQLGVPADQLGVADDLDKIFNSLFLELTKQGLGALGLGPGGLIAASSQSSGGQSLLNRLQSEAQTSATAAQANAQTEETGAQGLLIQTASSTTSGVANTSVPVPVDIALNKTVTAVPGTSQQNSGNLLVDGDTQQTNTQGFSQSFYGAITSNNPSGTGNNNVAASFTIDLGQQSTSIYKIVVYPRNPSNPGQYEQNWYTPTNGQPATFKVQILNQSNAVVWDSQTTGGLSPFSTFGSSPYTITVNSIATGRYVVVQGVTNGALQLAEVQVYQDTGPTITLNGVSVVTATAGETLGSVDTGASATDANGAVLPVTKTYTSTSGTVDGTTQIQTGQSYTVTYTATDSSGISSTATRTIIGQ
jgi:hypothetical protein